jgi:hypothetical protein
MGGIENEKARNGRSLFLLFLFGLSRLKAAEPTGFLVLPNWVFFTQLGFFLPNWVFHGNVRTTTTESY